jgi:hypothetical protein
VDKIVEVYKDPGAGKYQSMRKAKRGETIQLPAELDREIAVADILG